MPGSSNWLFSLTFRNQIFSILCAILGLSCDIYFSLFSARLIKLSQDQWGLIKEYMYCYLFDCLCDTPGERGWLAHYNLHSLKLFFFLTWVTQSPCTFQQIYFTFGKLTALVMLMFGMFSTLGSVFQVLRRKTYKSRKDKNECPSHILLTPISSLFVG